MSPDGQAVSGALNAVFVHVKHFLPICLLVAVGCAPRITLTKSADASALLKPALCESGEPAVTLWEVTSLRTGETHTFQRGKSAHVGEIYLRPGHYEVEAGCNRGKETCGALKGWIHMDGAPTSRFSVQAGDQITVDCEAANAALVLRR